MKSAVAELEAKGKAAKAAFRYLIYAMSGAMAILAGIVLIDIHVGSLEFTQFWTQFPQLPTSILWAILLLMGGGFAVKMAMMPFHLWQADAYAETPGAVAAPTAGLHFDQTLLDQLKDTGIQSTTVTLHVGAGTFQPVRVDNIEDHHMHAEWLEVPQSACEAITAAKARGGRVIAVGTTAVRSLETAAQGGSLEPFSGDSRIFIYPPYQFRVVDAMITNFHLPESTLLMLVSAFAGRESIMAAYRHAVEQRYRFFSYGDAMLLT